MAMVKYTRDTPVLSSNAVWIPKVLRVIRGMPYFRTLLWSPNLMFAYSGGELHGGHAPHKPAMFNADCFPNYGVQGGSTRYDLGSGPSFEY